MTTPLRIAVLGCGTHGSRYAEHLLAGDVPGATVVGVSRRSGEHASKWTNRGVRFDSDALALAVADDVDAVVVASPPHEHRPHAVAALEAGKHVLLEKPVAGTLADARAIGTAARETARTVLVGHSFRYNAVARAWRDEVQRMGTLRQMVLSMRHEWLAHPWQMKTECGGGALLTVGVHMADLARWVTGDEIAEVLACSTHALPGEADRGAAALAVMASGAHLSVDVSIDAPSRRGGLDAYGETGQAVGDYIAHTLHRRVDRDAVPVDVPPPGPGLVPLMTDFVSAVNGGLRGIAASLDDGIAAVKFAEDCLRAASNRP